MRNLLAKDSPLRSALMVGGFGLVAVVILIIIALLFVRVAGQAVTADKIFAAIYAQRQSARNASLTSSAESLATADMAILPYFEPNTFRTYESRVETGPAIGRCADFIGYPASTVVTRSVSFSDADFNFYSKYTSTAGDGTIMYYSLSNPNESYDYAGGGFAVKMPSYRYLAQARATTEGGIAVDSAKPADSVDSPLVSEMPQLLPDPVEPGSNFTIYDYFGPDARILGTETIDGVEHHIATWSYEGYCGDGDPNSSTVKLVSKVWVNSEDFSYSHEEIYLDSLNDTNLITRTSSSSSLVQTELATVAGEFVFDLSVAVREIDPAATAPGSESYNAAVRSKLQQTGVDLVSPTGLSLQYYSVNDLDLPDPYGYRHERDFYPAGQLGDQLYSRNAVDPMIFREGTVPSFSFGFWNLEGLSASLDVYDSQVSYADIGIPEAAVSEQIMIPVGGVQLNAQLFTNPYQYYDRDEFGSPGSGTSSSGRAGEVVVEPTPPELTFNSYALIFVREGRSHVAWLHGFVSAAEVQTLGFEVTSNVDNIMRILESVEQGRDVIAL